MIDDVLNIVFNLQSGLLPKDLSKNEVELLKKEFGEDWFTELGYTPAYQKPEFK